VTLYWPDDGRPEGPVDMAEWRGLRTELRQFLRRQAEATAALTAPIAALTARVARLEAELTLERALAEPELKPHAPLIRRLHAAEQPLDTLRWLVEQRNNLTKGPTHGR
jgi:hypothetical protein